MKNFSLLVFAFCFSAAAGQTQDQSDRDYMRFKYIEYDPAKVLIIDPTDVHITYDLIPVRRGLSDDNYDKDLKALSKAMKVLELYEKNSMVPKNIRKVLVRDENNEFWYFILDFDQSDFKSTPTPQPTINQLQFQGQGYITIHPKVFVFENILKITIPDESFYSTNDAVVISATDPITAEHIETSMSELIDMLKWWREFQKDIAPFYRRH
jgi:hypothetical protein